MDGMKHGSLRSEREHSAPGGIGAANELFGKPIRPPDYLGGEARVGG